MLVSGLESKALSTITSGNNGDIKYSQVHHLLCECARKLLAKYELKQESSPRMVAKTEAVQTLLFNLGQASEDEGQTRELISSALEKHVEALQGHEHLLSKRGNNYALLEQTEGLRKESSAPASLLRYHQLKDKFLGPESPLGTEQKQVIFRLSEDKSLSMKTLDILEACPDLTVTELMRINAIAFLKPDLCSVAFKQGDHASIVDYLLKLDEAGLLERDVCSAAFKHGDFVNVAKSLLKLNDAGLLKPKLCAEISRHENPGKAVIALAMLYDAGLFKEKLCAKVLKHKDPVISATVMMKLDAADLLQADLYSRALEHERPELAVDALIILIQNKLYTSDNWSALLKKENPAEVACALADMKLYGLAKPGNCAAVLAQDDSCKAAIDMMELSTTTLLGLHEADRITPELWTGILGHEIPGIAAQSLVDLYKEDLFEPDICTGVLGHKTPDLDLVVQALVELKHAGLATPTNCSVIIKQEDPGSAVKMMVRLSYTVLDRLNDEGLITAELWTGILGHKKPAIVAQALSELYKANLFKPDLCAEVVAHEDPVNLAQALIELKKNGLDTPGNCFVLYDQDDPHSVAKAMVELSTTVLNELHKAGRIGPSLWGLIAKHEQLMLVTSALVKLYEADLFKTDLCYWVAMCKNPLNGVQALMELKKNGLDITSNVPMILKQEDPYNAAQKMVKLSTTILAPLNEANLLTPELWDGILKSKDHFVAASSLVRLYEADLFKKDLCALAVAHEKPDNAAEAFVELDRRNLAKKHNCLAVTRCENPYNACLAIIRLDKHDLLTDENLEQVLAQENPAIAARELVVSILYDNLKNKLLGPETPLNTEQREFISELIENKGLTLKMFEDLEAEPVKTVTVMMNAVDLELKDFKMAYEGLMVLTRNGLDSSGNRLALRHKYHREAIAALMRLNSYYLLTDENRNKVLAQEDPVMAAKEVVEKYLSSVRAHDNLRMILETGIPLNAEQRQVISEMAERGILTQEILEALKIKPLGTASVLVMLYKAGLLEPDLLAMVFAHRKPDDVAQAFVQLNKNKLAMPEYYSAVSKHNDPLNTCRAIIRLHSKKWLTKENLDRVTAHESPMLVFVALDTLDKADLLTLKPDLCEEVFKHENPEEAAEAAVELVQKQLDSMDNRAVVFRHKKPLLACLAINCLYFYQLLTDKNRVQLLQEENPEMAAREMVNKIRRTSSATQS